MSGIIFINRNGLRWRDAPADYGPPNTLYNRWKRWSDKGVFARMLLELADQGQQTDTLMIDAGLEHGFLRQFAALFSDRRRIGYGRQEQLDIDT